MKICGRCHKNTLFDNIKIAAIRNNNLILTKNKWNSICEDCYNKIKDDPKYKEIKKNIKWVYAQLQYISR